MSATKPSSSAKSASVSPGKPTMSVVRSVTSGTAVADPRQQRVVGAAVAGPPHPLEDVRRRVLQRQVDVAADLLALRHRREHVVGDRGRVEVEQPDPGQAVDRVQLAQQPPERAALAAIDAEEGRVLRDEQQLAHAALGQRPRLADDRVRRAAAVLAAQRRDDAERAGVVAALGDLDVGEVLRRRQEARRVGVVEVVGDSGLGRSGLGTRAPASGVRARRLRRPAVAAISRRTSMARLPRAIPSSRAPSPDPGPIASRICALRPSRARRRSRESLSCSSSR